MLYVLLGSSTALRSLVLGAALVVTSATCSGAAEPSLPALNADIAQTSVSGISSGAFMAVQYQIAFSALVKGAGIVAGGPYYCAAGSVLSKTGSTRPPKWSSRPSTYRRRG